MKKLVEHIARPDSVCATPAWTFGRILLTGSFGEDVVEWNLRSTRYHDSKLT